MNQQPRSESPPADGHKIAATKSALVRESLLFLTKTYRLIAVAGLVYTLGPLATVAVGIGLMTYALWVYPSGSSVCTANTPGCSGTNDFRDFSPPERTAWIC